MNKEKWEVRMLGEVCEIIAGGDIPRDNYSKEKTKDYQVPVYSNGVKDDGLYGYTNVSRITKPSITVSARGTIGFSVKRLDEFYPVVRLIVVTPLNPEQLDLAFLHYSIKSIDFTSSGTSIPQLTVPMIKKYNIPIPPLNEQQRIVSLLDEAFEALDEAQTNAEKNLENAKELFESYLEDVFASKDNGWEEKELGDLGRVSMCRRIFKNQTAPTGDIPFYKIGTFGREPDAYITKELYDEYVNASPFPKKGDVMISASGTIGRRVVYNGKPAYFQDSNIVWIDNDEGLVLNEFLYHFYGACKWTGTQGATIARLYNKNLRETKITFPKSKDRQLEIVKEIDALSVETKQLESHYLAKLKSLEELRKSILEKAFNGGL